MEQEKDIKEILNSEINENLNNKIMTIQQILLKKQINDEEIKKLNTFFTNYIKINNYRLNAIDLSEEEKIFIDWYLSQVEIVINPCYEEPLTQAKSICLNIFNQKNSFDIPGDNKANNYTRTKLKNGIRYYEDQDEIYKINGFIKPIFIIIGVILLGIILALVMHKL